MTTRRTKFKRPPPKCSRWGCTADARTSYIDAEGKRHQVCIPCWSQHMDNQDKLKAKPVPEHVDHKKLAAGDGQ